MSKQIMSNEVLFKKLSEDTGETAELVAQDFQKICEEVKSDSRYINISQADVEQIARNKLIVRKRREMNSPAITWEGEVLLKMDLIDGVKRAKAMSEVAYKKDPVSTQNEKGWMYEGKLVRTDSNGVPLYPKTDANDKWHRSGQPLPEHSWMRTIVGVAAPVDKKTHKAGEAKIFTMTLNDTKALPDFVKAIPTNVPIRLKGTDKTTDESRKAGEYNIGASAYTTFELAPDLKLPPTEVIIGSVLANKVVVLGQLEEWHLGNSDKWGTWFVTEGTVSMLAMEPNKNNSLFMSLDDESLLFVPTEDGKTATVASYIPTDRGIVIDFSQDSRIFVFGRSSQGKKKDAQGNKTDELGAVGINVYGIYCPEMFKVVQPNKPIPKGALDAVVEPEPSTEEPPAGEW